MRERSPIHPGEVLLEDFLVPLNLTKYRLAKDIGVPPTRIQDILGGEHGISADTALRPEPLFRNKRRALDEPSKRVRA